MEDVMEKRKSENKENKKQYKKPELTRHEKLTLITGGDNPNSLVPLGCTRS